MLVTSKTPLRISLFGGGTDYPQWFHEHGGEVLGGAISAYSHIHLRRSPVFFDHRFRVCYSKLEEVSDYKDLSHPAVPACIEHVDSGLDGLEIFYSGDLPSRSGLGSSSSFTVGLLNALYLFTGQRVGKRHLYESAIDIEQNRLKERVGVQDQILTAIGGFNHIKISRSGKKTISSIPLHTAAIKTLQDHLLLVSTGISRYASQVAKSQIESMDTKANQHLALMKMVLGGINYITKGDMKSTGALLHDGWMIKRELTTKISNGIIDGIYSQARTAGAYGGKLLGAGGGGFLLLLAPPALHQELRDSLSPLKVSPVSFDRFGSRTRRIVY